MRAGPMKPLKVFVGGNEQKLRFKRQMRILYDFKSGYFSAPPLPRAIVQLYVHFLSIIYFNRSTNLARTM